MVKLEIPGNAGKILVHSCCAPCSGAILECMVDNGLRPAVFFSNSNIDSREEFDKRLGELRRYCGSLGLDLVVDEYDHEGWLEAVKGLENEPERGARCLKCFRFRLGRAAAFAADNGFDLLTTSLASSRWKSLEQVDKAGSDAVGECREKGCVLEWWPRNWRRDGLQPRRDEIIREQGFYNQTWCGCEFSHRKEGND
ncbi:MAG: epoxyqueuosine reductase QueH [Bacteroidales bacterium]|nr:epoxyqueuosine reductase QueH [Bacteroidales bacterium]